MYLDVTHTFTAVVGLLGINPYVRIPARMSRAFNIRGAVPVAGSLNGAAIRGNLVPTGDFRHRLYLNTDMRARANVKVGDRVTITLSLDRRPRPVKVPQRLNEALSANKKAKAAWDAVTPSHRKEILAYLNSLKRPESLDRNVVRVIARLVAGKVSRH